MTTCAIRTTAEQEFRYLKIKTRDHLTVRFTVPNFGASDPQVVYNISTHPYVLANVVTMISHGEELGLPSKMENYQVTRFCK